VLLLEELDSNFFLASAKPARRGFSVVVLEELVTASKIKLSYDL
jgi:hypothetical protein